MKKEHEELLTTNLVGLKEKIELDEDLWGHLIAAKILTRAKREEIKLNNTTRKQVDKLLEFLQKGDDDVFDKFCQCLISTGQEHVVRIYLKPGEEGNEDPEATVNDKLKESRETPGTDRVDEGEGRSIVEEVKVSTDDGQTNADDVQHENYKTSILRHCESLPPKPDCMPIKKLPVIEDKVNTEAKFRRCTLALIFVNGRVLAATLIENRVETEKTRTLIMVGATGAGKTMLVDGLVNYVLGVEFTDDYRFTIIDLKDEEKERVGNEAVTQTSWITCYHIPRVKGFKMSSALQIVDMPGFGARDAAEDRELIERLRILFNTSPADGGIAELNLACFVIPASQDTMTATQKYIFHSFLSIFDKTIADNICPFITFSASNSLRVLTCLKKGGIPCDEYFVFNNSALFARDPGNKFVDMFWEMGEQCYEKAVTHLMKMKSKSLLLTSEVLNNRCQIRLHIRRHFELQGQMKVIMAERDALQKYSKESEEYKNFEYLVPESTNERIPLISGEFAMNCSKCSTTCHYPCTIKDNAERRKCSVMSSGVCTTCPKKCGWWDHKNDSHRWEIVQKTVKKTFTEMQRKYRDSLQGSTKSKDILGAMRKEFDKMKNSVQQLMDEATKLANRLKETELKLNQASIGVEYFEMMIASEEHGREPGYQKRVAMLRDALEEYQLIEQIKNKEFNPWRKYMEVLFTEKS